ncbi:MAG: hypothetical protein HKP11_07880, partial [Flavobacteriaceae bacterium]|nr:hypothetical protein [Flavobacteriaceae bacterium]
MKNLIYIMVFILCLAACKNSTEEQETAEAKVNETILDIEPEIEIPEEVLEEETEGSEETEAVPKSIFDIDMSMVYIKKEDLDESEMSKLHEILDNNPELTETNLITDIDTEYGLNLQSLKSHLSKSDETFKAVRDILELNVAPASISMGYEIDGRERIREFTGSPTGGFMEDMTEYYMFKGRSAGKNALRRLGVASDDNVVPILLEYFEVSSDELDLLKSFPGTERHSNSLAAKAAINFELSSRVTDHLKSSKCSEGFKYAIKFFEKRQIKESKRFMLNAKKAKDAFYKLNPGWYGEDD